MSVYLVESPEEAFMASNNKANFSNFLKMRMYINARFMGETIISLIIYNCAYNQVPLSQLFVGIKLHS